MMESSSVSFHTRRQPIIYSEGFKKFALAVFPSDEMKEYLESNREVVGRIIDDVINGSRAKTYDLIDKGEINAAIRLHDRIRVMQKVYDYWAKEVYED